jgi:sugar phosphate isomerase/epimerase
MKLGVYDAILHDQPLPDALRTVHSLGLSGIEIDAGGFLPPVHCPSTTSSPAPPPPRTTSASSPKPGSS